MRQAGLLSFLFHGMFLVSFFWASSIGHETELPESYEEIVVDIGYGPGVGLREQRGEDEMVLGSVHIPPYVPRPSQPPKVLFRHTDVPPRPVRPYAERIYPRDLIAFDNGLIIGNYQTIQRHFQDCWRQPTLLDFSDGDIVIGVRLRINKEGHIVGSVFEGKERIDESPSYYRVYESILHAIKHPLCRKIHFKEEDYPLWQEIDIEFSARNMRGE
ncbi:MAG: hypothetical protein GDA54_05555 [Alphaproteobacteria bacterium GM7ARS4]|nr:hypothetical protein [Alphaproteobacteria bacterium GM7ARS4]